MIELVTYNTNLNKVQNNISSVGVVVSIDITYAVDLSYLPLKSIVNLVIVKPENDLLLGSFKLVWYGGQITIYLITAYDYSGLLIILWLDYNEVHNTLQR
jgi:hypothetical protein